MKRVSLKDLKQNLSSWVEIAHQGDVVEVMKHNRPFVMITPWALPHVRVGSKVGQGQLESCLENATQGKWERYLNEDRDS